MTNQSLNSNTNDIYQFNSYQIRTIFSHFSKFCLLLLFFITLIGINNILTFKSILSVNEAKASDNLSSSKGALSKNKGEIDLLHQVAQISDKAPFSILMDIDRVKDSLVTVGKVYDRFVTVGERGHILYSDDNGETWTQAQVPVSVTLTSLYFPTAKKGWAVGHDGVILHSQDGAESWTKQIDGITINQLMLIKIKELIKSAQDRLKSAGDQEREDIEIELEKLEFFLNDAKMAQQEGPTRPLMDVWFKDDLEGIAIGAFGIILRTEDGGKNWTPILDRIENPDGFHYYSITKSGDALFIAGEAGIIFRSDDLGLSWKRLESPYEGSFFGIAGNYNGTMLAVFGLRGSMFFSFDKGDTWTEADKDKGASILGGLFLSDGSLCVAGVDGIISRSTDNGKTFSQLPHRFPGTIAITEANDRFIIVTGTMGVKRVKYQD